jgi:phospholipid/cholesterol/gamma-HCH transport system substrate-binding protein
VNTETKVGAFVIACVAVLTGAIFYVGNAQWRHRMTAYKTYLHYAGGITPGSDVLFGGIEAGKVTAVRPLAEDPARIEVTFEVNDSTPLNEKSVAKLGSVSLMSSPALSIIAGSGPAARLKPGQTVASQEAVSIDDMMAKLSGITDNASQLIGEVRADLKGISGQAQTLLTNLDDATGPRNRRQLAGILQQANDLLAQESPKLDRIADQVLQTTKDVDSTVKKADPLLDHADTAIATVTSTIDQLRDPMRADLAQLQSTMEQAKSLIANVQILVRGNDDNIRETIENLRIASENLDQLTDGIKQQPWSLIRIRQAKDRQVPK